MTPSARQDFWLDKLNEVLALDFTREEQAHINQLIAFVTDNVDLFEHGVMEDTTTHEYAMYNGFIESWCDYATDTLGWDKGVIYAVAANAGVLTNSLLSNFRRGNYDVESFGYQYNCNCSTKSDHCGRNKRCNTGPCSHQREGCGLFWVYSCDGQCARVNNN